MIVTGELNSKKKLAIENFLKSDGPITNGKGKVMLRLSILAILAVSFLVVSGCATVGVVKRLNEIDKEVAARPWSPATKDWAKKEKVWAVAEIIPGVGHFKNWFQTGVMRASARNSALSQLGLAGKYNESWWAAKETFFKGLSTLIPGIIDYGLKWLGIGKLGELGYPLGWPMNAVNWLTESLLPTPV